MLPWGTRESDNASAGEDMKISGIKIAFLVILCVAVGFEVWQFRSAPTTTRQNPRSAGPKKQPDFVLLPAGEATGLARFFAGPNARIEGWEPTVGDMNDVESNLPQITALSNKDPDTSRRIDDPTKYFRQYGAATIDGRKVLILNAFCPLGQDKSSIWRKQVITVNDGGNCYWRALFDLSTQKFTTLSVNGVA